MITRRRRVRPSQWCLVAALLLANVAAAAAAPPEPAASAAPAPSIDPALADREPIIELVTMGIGALIWERHGHIALCVRYRDPRLDACYNYGIGKFDEPFDMAWGFFRGTDSFWVGKMDREWMFDIYRDADRTIWVQRLPLTDEEKQQVIAKLEYDIEDAHRHYSYDHFWDNCTTRVRDVLDHATGGALSSMKQPTDARTFRDLAREGFFGMRIPLLGTDVAMGWVTDRVPSYFERMFLPDYMREAAMKRWQAEPEVVYQRRGPPPLHDGPSGRWLLALIILAATAPSWLTAWWGRLGRTGLAIAILPPALLGLAFWFLAIISPLPYVRWNLTCLVLVPFDLALPFLRPPARRRYARGRLVMLGAVAALLALGILDQPLFAPMLWPLVPLAVAGLWPSAPRRATSDGSSREVG